MRTLLILLLLSGTTLAGDLGHEIGTYLRAEPGSEKQAAALAKIRVYWDSDRAAVEEAVRGDVSFPPAEPGTTGVEIPLPPLDDDPDAPRTNAVVVHVPRGYDPARRWPLLLVVHGSGGVARADVDALAGFADQHGLLLVGPQDQLGRGGGGWSYTPYEHTLHVRALTWAKRRYNVDDARVFVFGGSRGGHAAWDLACSHPDLFAGAVPVCGGPRDRWFRLLPNLRHVPLLDMQGAQDQAGLVKNVRDAVKLLTGWSYDVTYEEDPKAGHYFSVDWPKVWKWMEGRRRPAYPREVVRVALRDDRSSAYWIRMAGLPRKKFEGVKQTRVPTDRKVSREEIQELVRENYGKYCAKVTAKAEGDTVDLAMSKAPKVVVYLHDRLVDLDGKVVIRVNGRVRRKAVVPRSLETMLERVRETGDRDLLYSAAVEVRGSAR